MADSTVLVTGAGEGLGREVATAFAAQGWTVAVGAEAADELEETVAACEAEGVSATGIRANVRDEFDLERLAKTAAGVGPSAGIDAVVPAGEARHEDREAPIDEASYAAFDDHWRANARGVFATIREALPHLTETGRVLVPTAGTSDEAPAGSYGVSKAGAAAVARAFASDTAYAVGRIDPTARRDDEGDLESAGSLFVWAATAVDASALDDARLTRADREESLTDA